MPAARWLASLLLALALVGGLLFAHPDERAGRAFYAGWLLWAGLVCPSGWLLLAGVADRGPTGLPWLYLVF